MPMCNPAGSASYRGHCGWQCALDQGYPIQHLHQENPTGHPVAGFCIVAVLGLVLQLTALA